MTKIGNCVLACLCPCSAWPPNTTSEFSRKNILTDRDRCLCFKACESKSLPDPTRIAEVSE